MKNKLTVFILLIFIAIISIIIAFYKYNKYHIDYTRYDTISDNSIQKFIGIDNHYNDISYTPELVTLNNAKYYYFRNKDKKIQIAKVSEKDFTELSKAFYNKFETPMLIISAYRSFDYQKSVLKNNKGCRPTLCAKPGYSEHQSGLAIDIFDSSDNDTFLNNVIYKGYYDWLKDNAYKYGYTNSYNKGSEIDGYEKEPWHWRYVGVELATKLYNNNITFTEFNNKRSSLLK